MAVDPFKPTHRSFDEAKAIDRCCRRFTDGRLILPGVPLRSTPGSTKNTQHQLTIRVRLRYEYFSRNLRAAVASFLSLV